MPIMRTVKGTGEIVPYKWADYIIPFLAIPKEYLKGLDPKVLSLPRTARSFKMDRSVMDFVESDYFRLLIVDVYAFMVWPFLNNEDYMEIYSGYDPIWKIAHIPEIWINALIELERIPMTQTWLQEADPDEYMGFIPLREMDLYLSVAVPYALKRYNLREMVDYVQKHHCFEDFDYRKSQKKTQFFNKWYHIRTKHPMASLDDYMEDYRESHDGQEWDVMDESPGFESDVETKVLADQFMTMLSEKDRRILELRLQEWTLEEIAEELGYANHTGVLKRIRKIGQAFERFADVDYDFEGRRII